jgi:cell division septation protein DedD
MDKNSAYQLELFTPGADSSQARLRETNGLFAFLRGHEKTILLMIGAIALGVVCFGLGVEKGKGMVSPSGAKAPKESLATRSFKRQPAAKQAVAVPAPAALPAPVAAKEPAKAVEKAPAKFLEKQGFVIQLASYKNKSLADREAKALREKGFTPVLYPKGEFTVLCVGSIANKEAAFSMLPELRKRYSDCYIRRL